MNKQEIRELPKTDWARWVQWVGSVLVIPGIIALGIWIMRVEVWMAETGANRYTIQDARADWLNHDNVHGLLPPDLWREKIQETEERVDVLEPRLLRIELMLAILLKEQGIEIPDPAKDFKP